MSSWVMPLWSLWRREMVRFLRQKGRVIGALGPPIVFWFLIGSGLGHSFQATGASANSVNYLQYFFPGTVVLIVMFTAIFSTISLIEDRHEGFLQAVLVAPVPRTVFVLGKIFGGSSLALGQALLFLIAAPLAGLTLTLQSGLMAILILLFLSIGLTALGFLLAWKLDSTQGFHAVMNLFLIPMWLLSGALFPAAGAPFWLRGIMELNPLSYALSSLQSCLLAGGHSLSPVTASLPISLGVNVIFAVGMTAICVGMVRKGQ